MARLAGAGRTRGIVPRRTNGRRRWFGAVRGAKVGFRGDCFAKTLLTGHPDHDTLARPRLAGGPGSFRRCENGGNSTYGRWPPDHRCPRKTRTLTFPMWLAAEGGRPPLREVPGASGAISRSGTPSPAPGPRLGRHIGTSSMTYGEGPPGRAVGRHSMAQPPIRRRHGGLRTSSTWAPRRDWEGLLFSDDWLLINSGQRFCFA